MSKTIQSQIIKVRLLHVFLHTWTAFLHTNTEFMSQIRFPKKFPFVCFFSFFNNDDAILI